MKYDTVPLIAGMVVDLSIDKIPGVKLPYGTVRYYIVLYDNGGDSSYLFIYLKIKIKNPRVLIFCIFKYHNIFIL